MSNTNVPRETPELPPNVMQPDDGEDSTLHPTLDPTPRVSSLDVGAPIAPHQTWRGTIGVVDYGEGRTQKAFLMEQKAMAAVTVVTLMIIAGGLAHEWLKDPVHVWAVVAGVFASAVVFFLAARERLSGNTIFAISSQHDVHVEVRSHGGFSELFWALGPKKEVVREPYEGQVPPSARLDTDGSFLVDDNLVLRRGRCTGPIQDACVVFSDGNPRTPGLVVGLRGVPADHNDEGSQPAFFLDPDQAKTFLQCMFSASEDRGIRVPHEVTRLVQDGSSK